MADIFNTINGTAVSPELLLEVLEMHIALSPADRGVFEIRVARIFELLDAKGLAENRDALAMAINYRIDAMVAAIVGYGEAQGWTLPDAEPGVYFIDLDLVQAATEEPVVEDPNDGHAAFDPTSFQRRVLRIAEARGHA
jgi:hypothetical protein